MTDSNDDPELADAKAYMEQLGDNTRLLLDAKHGRLNDLPRSVTRTFDGDEPADALGKAYAMRDAIRDGGYECEANLLGEHEGYAWSDDDWYEIEFVIEAAE